jgi:hypothetical protein
MRITRRTFLRVVALCGASLAVGWVAWRDSFTSLFGRGAARLVALVLSPEQQLRAHFRYLDLDQDGVDRYFADYQHHQEPLPRRRPLPPDVYMRYLLSTDFFLHGADESRRVHYVGFVDPYVTPCSNPLARLDGP